MSIEVGVDRIRNFSIIAHIDHGKSSLADCFMELTGAVDPSRAKERLLDSMDLERERGITIKAQTVRMNFKSRDGQTYQLNLIDTPGHADFSYEVSRSLSACEGALLVVDASQGVEAQTLANSLLALENHLEILPVINKIDLPSQRTDEVMSQLKDLLGIKEDEILKASAKTKTGIAEILEAVVQRVPPPAGEASSPLKALIFDSWFDSYQGVTALCRVKQGRIRKGDRIFLKGTQKSAEVLEMGVFTPFASPLAELKAGESGFIITGIKDIGDMRVGDTLVHADHKEIAPLPGFKKPSSMVFSGIFPVSADDFQSLKKALEKLSLNDSSLSFEPESSRVLGFGFRCGFLGPLHMDIVQERLEREFQLNLIRAAPSVIYKVRLKNGDLLDVENPSLLPDPSRIDFFEEPLAKARIHSPVAYLGALLKLCEERRGRQSRLEYLAGNRVVLHYIIPLSEMISDFHDRLKSATRGYASMDYELTGYEQSSVVKLDILLNGESIDALSLILHRSQAEKRGRALALKLKTLIPKQQFPVAIQAVLGARVIARETVSAYRKDVTAKLYGGDVTRKKKLLEKQKAGKKRMKAVGKIEIPQKAFTALMKP